MNRGIRGWHAVFTAVLVCSVGAATVHAAQTMEPLNVGYIPSNSIYWDIDVAIERGLFQQAGFAPAVVAIQSSPQSMQMIIGGSVQMASTQPEALAAALARGAKELAVIAAPAGSPDWFLVARRGIEGWAALRGQTLGFGALRVSEFWLVRRLLSEHGIKPGEFNAIQVGPTPAKMAALQKGSIAAAVLFQPTGVLAEKMGLKVLYNFAVLKHYPALVYVVNRGWAAGKQHGSRLSRALVRAHDWLEDPKNHDEAIAVLAKYTKQPADVLDAVYKLYFVTGKLYSRDAALDIAGLEGVIHDITSDYPAFSLYAAKDITRMEDLSGKTIGVTAAGTSSETTAKLFLTHFGLLGQVRIVPTGGSNAATLAALEKGVVTGAILAPPATAQAAKAGLVELINGIKLGVPFTLNGMVVTRSYLQQHRDAVERFLRAYRDAWTFTAAPANESAVLKVLASYTKAPPDVAKVSYDYLLPIWTGKKIPTVDPRGIATALRFSPNPKAKNATPDAFIDNSIIASLK